MAEVKKSNDIDENVIEKAAEIIKSGGVVVYPTDTLYGLGVNALDSNSVKKIFEIKGRDFNKPLSIAVHNLEDAKKYAEFSPLALVIAKKFLPGPMTLILPSKTILPNELNQGDEKVRLRIPDNKIALELIKISGVPLTSTSANLSGGKDPITAEDSIDQIGDKVDYILDSGKCKYGQGSTILEIIDEKVEFIREGVISKKIINNFIQRPT